MVRMQEHKKGIIAIIACSASIFWVGAFVFGFPGVMAPYWQQTLQVGRGAIGNILFFNLAAVGVFMFLVGRWQEKVGTRRMITFGTIAVGLDIFAAAYASSLVSLYVWSFVLGAASCFIYIPSLTVVQKWFPMRRGLVVGIVNLTFGASAAVMAPVFGLLFDFLGYFHMIVVLSVVALAVGIVAAQFTGGPPMSPSMAQMHAAGPNLPLVGRSFTVAEAVKTRSFWFLWFTCALQGAAGIAMIMLSATFGLAKGWSLESAVLILTAFNLTNGVGRFTGGVLSDIFGRNLTMSVTFLAAGICYLVLPHCNWLPLVVFLASVIGLGFGTLLGVSAPLVTDCFGIKHFGAIFGLIFTAYGFLAGPLGPSLSGYLLDFTKGDFVLVFGYLGALCIVSSVLISFVKPPIPIDKLHTNA